MKLQVWDYAAASLVIKEAGGFISSLDINYLPLDRPSLVAAANTYENLEKLLAIGKKYF